MLAVPADITVVSSVAVAVDIGTATASDLFEPVTISNDAPALFPVGTTLVTWTATDANGNTGTAQQQVTVSATAPPPDSDGDGVPDATDLCPSTPAGEPVDADGCSASQLGPDLVAPVVTPPAAVSVEAVGVTSPVALGTATAVDDRDGVVAVSSDAPAAFPLGTTTVTYSAVDSAGNTGTATQLVTVVDTTPPALTVPSDVNVVAADYDPVTVALGTATATDIFGPVAVANDAPATFTVGTTLVTWTATDTNGNLSTATQNVTVTLSDTDNDGVADVADYCPGTAPGDTVDALGCAATQTPASGDVNGDGQLNLADVILAQRHVLGIELLAVDAIMRADLYPVGGDGQVTLSDVLLIQRALLEK